MEEFFSEISAGNVGSHVIVFIVGFFLGKKIAKMGFIFMMILAVGGYFAYQSINAAPAQ